MEAFRYLVLFTALGITAFSVVGLFFTLVDYLFYDPAAVPVSPDTWVPGVLWAVARVIIAFPVFLIASWLVARSLDQDPAGRGSAIRRWFTYLAMFVAVAVIIGDFVTLVAYVLAGGTTARFLLKVLVVAVVAGLILGYYLWDIRDTERGRRPVPALFLGVAALASVAAVGRAVADGSAVRAGVPPYRRPAGGGPAFARRRRRPLLRAERRVAGEPRRVECGAADASSARRPVDPRALPLLAGHRQDVRTLRRFCATFG